jgi:hypothetical protein
MRQWMMAAGAVVLMAAGSAGAVEQATGVVAPATGTTSSDTRRDVASGVAPTKATPGDGLRTAADGSGFVTRDELTRFRNALLEQLERERNEQHPEPTFTDAG